MPIKVCPQCGAKFGARKLKCDCGHDFGCKRSGKAAIQVSETPPLESEPTGEPITKLEPQSGEVVRRRGKKICPKCGAEYGARKLKCDCGHDFGCKRSGKAATKAGDAPHSFYPEPGAWVLDKTRGMPDIVPPEPLSRGPISAAHVKEIVFYEGLGYAVYSYVPTKRISDPKLRKLWDEARAVMQRVVEYLDGVRYDK